MRISPSQDIEPITLQELMASPRKVTSEERWHSLSVEKQSHSAFVDKALDLKHLANLETKLASHGDQVPKLDKKTWFKYESEFDRYRKQLSKKKDLLISLVMEEGRIIGFAIALLKKDGSAIIKILDVDADSRRSSGVAVDLQIEETQFSIGVGHLAIQILTSHLRGTITVDATSSASRFLFKSLGFVHVEGDPNPCHLLRSQLYTES